MNELLMGLTESLLSPREPMLRHHGKDGGGGMKPDEIFMMKPSVVT
jgi:hypothetical protein